MPMWHTFNKTLPRHKIKVPPGLLQRYGPNQMSSTGPATLWTKILFEGHLFRNRLLHWSFQSFFVNTYILCRADYGEIWSCQKKKKTRCAEYLDDDEVRRRWFTYLLISNNGERHTESRQGVDDVENVPDDLITCHSSDQTKGPCDSQREWELQQQPKKCLTTIFSL